MSRLVHLNTSDRLLLFESRMPANWYSAIVSMPRTRQSPILLQNTGGYDHWLKWAASLQFFFRNDIPRRQNLQVIRLTQNTSREHRMQQQNLRICLAITSLTAWINSSYCQYLRYFRRAGTTDERCCCDRRTCRQYARGEAREGYAQVSFLGALGWKNWNTALARARKDTAR